MMVRFDKAEFKDVMGFPLEIWREDDSPVLLAALLMLLWPVLVIVGLMAAVKRVRSRA